MIIQMPRAAAASTIGVRAGSSVREPVGLHGELMMIAFVFGVIAAMIFSGCTVKPSSGLVWTITGVALASLICSGMVGQYGACVITSSPGLNNASAVLNSACLPPLVIRTSAGVKSMFQSRLYCAQTASRNSGIPMAFV